MTKIVCVQALVEVVIRDGVEVDDDTVKLAADTAANRENATAENVSARVLFRERRIVGAGNAGERRGV